MQGSELKTRSRLYSPTEGIFEGAGVGRRAAFGPAPFSWCNCCGVEGRGRKRRRRKTEEEEGEDEAGGRLHALPRPHRRPLNECRGKNSSEPGLIASASPTFTAERETLSFRWVPQPDGPPSYIRSSEGHRPAAAWELKFSRRERTGSSASRVCQTAAWGVSLPCRPAGAAPLSFGRRASAVAVLAHCLLKGAEPGLGARFISLERAGDASAAPPTGGERSADFLQRGVSGVSHLHVSVLGARKLLAVSAWRRAGACPVTPTRTPQSGKSHVLAPPAGLLELWWKRRSELRFSSTASLLRASAQQVVGAPRAALLYGQEDQG